MLLRLGHRDYYGTQPDLGIFKIDAMCAGESCPVFRTTMLLLVFLVLAMIRHPV